MIGKLAKRHLWILNHYANIKFPIARSILQGFKIGAPIGENLVYKHLNNGGETGILTLERIAPSRVFETG